MSILYLHGVGHRPGRRADRITALRAALLQRYLGPLVRRDGPADIVQPVWSDLGAWDDPLLEPHAAAIETLGLTESGNREALGWPELVDSLSETVARGRAAPARALSRPAIQLAMNCLRRPLTAAAGDLLIWLEQRRMGLDGPIIGRVAAAIDPLAARGREPLVLIGHSLGGVLLTESLALRPVPHPAMVLVTVGCPVALFAALGILSGPLVGLVRWLNVLDPADPLAYAAHDTWPLAEDWRYQTGALLWPHGGYLSRPSFHRRLAARLATGPPWR